MMRPIHFQLILSATLLMPIVFLAIKTMSSALNSFFSFFPIVIGFLTVELDNIHASQTGLLNSKLPKFV